MKTRILSLTVGLSLALMVFGPLGRSQDTTPPADLDQGVFDQLAAVSGDVPEVTAELKKEGVETQLKGAVHDAFAEAVTEPTPGPVVPKDPPKDLEEMPPADKPEGEDIQWYGGYWEFDQDRADFTWISGIYRKPPPRRQWMSGHWVKVEGGWQRQRGVWMTLEITTITFIPTAPPEAPVEAVANTAPDNNSFFVPGHHEYQETSYVWKPGKWVPNHPNWVWIPAHWVWTPCGYVFVPGYWDFLLELRGLLYAPVCVDPAYIKPGWTYTPSCVVHNSCLLEALFVRPGCGYFFGSYFKNKAYTCWPDHCVRGKICDPLFTHYKLHHKSKNNWEGGLRNLYTGRQSGRIASPPSNLNEFGKFVQDFKNKNIGANQVRQNLLVGSAKKINTNVVRMQKLDNAGLQGQKRFSDQLRNAGKDLAFKQTQHLQTNRGGNNGAKVLKFDADKSVNSHFRNLNSGRNGNNNGQSGNKNGGKVLGGLQGNGNGNGSNLFNRNGNNSGNNNNGNNNGSKNSNGLGNNARILQGNGNGQGNGNNNNNNNNGSKNGNGPGNSTRILNGNGSGNSGLTPKINQGGSNGNSNGNGGNSTIRRFEGSNNNNGNNGSSFRNLQQNGGNTTIKNFQQSGGNSTIRSFQQNSGNSGSSGFKSIQNNGGSSSSQFKSSGGSSGGNRGGSGSGGGGRRGR